MPVGGETGGEPALELLVWTARRQDRRRAALDFISGHRTRAPLWAQRGGVEWLRRVLRGPRRLALRAAAGAATLFKMSCPTILPRNPPLVAIEAD